MHAEHTAVPPAVDRHKKGHIRHIIYHSSLPFHEKLIPFPDRQADIKFVVTSKKVNSRSNDCSTRLSGSLIRRQASRPAGGWQLFVALSTKSGSIVRLLLFTSFFLIRYPIPRLTDMICDIKKEEEKNQRKKG